MFVKTAPEPSTNLTVVTRATKYLAQLVRPKHVLITVINNCHKTEPAQPGTLNSLELQQVIATMDVKAVILRQTYHVNRYR